MKDNFITPLAARLFEIDNELDRFDFLALLSLNAPPFPTEYKTDENRLVSCETKTWYKLDYYGTVRLSIESDSLFVRGLCLVLADIVSTADAKMLSRGIGFADECYSRGIVNDARRRGLLSLEEIIKKYINTVKENTK